MALSVFLTSDLHLGMKFAGYPEAPQAALVEARFACLSRMVEEAGRRRCDLLVVAGDLFDRISVTRHDIQRAAETLRSFPGKLVAVLPGNHDYLGPGDSSGRRSVQRAGTPSSCWTSRAPGRWPATTWMPFSTPGLARRSIRS